MTNHTRSGFNMKNIIYTSTLLLTSMASTNTYAQSDYKDALTTVIEVSESINGEYLPVRFTLTNVSDQAVKVLKWNTPLEAGFNANMFEVWSGTEKIDYIGRYVKRDNPSPGDYVIIQPGEGLSNTVDIASGYATYAQGNYEVSFNSLINFKHPTATLKNSTSDSPLSAILASSEISVHMDRDKPVKKQKEISVSYQGCGELQIAATKNALLEAETMAYDAAESLRLTPEHERSRASRYKTWFGRYTEGNYQTVSNNFDRIYDALTNKKVNFDCTCPLFSQSTNIFAYVFPKRPYDIYLCRVFWQVTAAGKDSKGGTILHELSHFDTVAATDDFAYGHPNSKALARQASTFAIRNADSYGYFAENSSIEPMGTVEIPGKIFPLEVDQTISGALTAGKWRYFETTGVESIDLFDLSGNAGLYVKAGSKPSLFNFDCKPNQSGKSEESCLVNRDEKIFIGLYSPVNIDQFTLKASEQESVRVYPQKGLWWNPEKSGSGFDVELSGNNLSVIWYTYDKNAHPVWYLASAPYSGHSWKANIKQYSWNGQNAVSTDVGVMQMTFSDDTQAKLSWALDGFSGDEAINYLSFANAPSDKGNSGIWYQPAKPGSGVTFIDQGSVTTAVLYFYDAQGKPRWALGNASGSIKSNPDDYSYQLETYLGGACPYCAYTAPSSVPVGELVMDLSNANHGRLYTDISLKAPLSGSWNVDNSVIENLAP